MSLAEQEFEVFVTVDQNLRFQQRLVDRKIAVIVLMVRANKIESVLPVVPQLLTALKTIKPGEVVIIKKPE